MSVKDLRLKFLTLDAEVQGHIHAGLRSAPLHNKAYVRRYKRKLTELQDARDAARADWRKVCELETIVQPSRREGMVIAANGHDDLESTQAARRLCVKNGWDWENER